MARTWENILHLGDHPLVAKLLKRNQFIVDNPILESEPVKMPEKGAGAGSPSVALRLELKENEKEILRRQIHTPEPQMSRLALLYTCTTPYDLLLLVISSIAAIIGGALQPVSFVSCFPQVFNLRC
jgi:hypothetical protein